MKTIFTIFLTFTTISHFAQDKIISHSQFIPLKIGNYWVYSSTDHLGKSDTVKITKTKIIGKDTAYNYNGNFFLERNDTIYDFQSQWNGFEFPTIQYFPSDEEREFSISIGGDVLSRRKVKKLENPYRVKGKEYNNCYKFTERIENGDAYTIISYGIGIIEISSPGKIIMLTDYKIE
jgi:hypothetical protein